MSICYEKENSVFNFWVKIFHILAAFMKLKYLKLLSHVTLIIQNQPDLRYMCVCACDSILCILYVYVCTSVSW